MNLVLLLHWIRGNQIKKIFLVPSAHPISPVHNIGNFPANEVKNNMSFKFHLQKRNTHQSNKDVGQSQRKTKG